MKKKTLITLTASLVLIATVGIGSTLAYFTDNDAQTNVITMGHVDITLTETSDDLDAKVTDDGITYDDVVPGKELSKKPVVTLDEDSEDAYIRVMANAKFVDADGTEVSIMKNDVNVTDAYKAQIIEACNFGEKWTLGEDGYWYYADKLTQAENTAEVFTTVNVPTAWGNEVADKQFVIELTAEAIQADNFTPGEAGWVDAEGNAITAETYSAN